MHKKVLTPENIGEAFRESGVPNEVDYVSTDVDSIDVWLFHGLLASGYRPRVVSVEYNSNFPMDTPLACERKWVPWKRKSRIYGSSAASINLVAEMFGYQVVEIMPKLDMFFVLKDTLDSICTAESLASYEFLAKEFVGVRTKSTCSREEAQRLVDFPLALKGLETEAKAKAMANIEEMNRMFWERFNGPFCAI